MAWIHVLKNKTKVTTCATPQSHDLRCSVLGSDQRFGPYLSQRHRAQNSLPDGGATIRPFVYIISQVSDATHTHSPSAFNTTAPPPGGEVLPLVEESEIRVSKGAVPQQSCSGQSLHQILLHLVLITAPSIPREQTAGGGASVGLFYHHIQTQDHKLTSHDVSPEGCGCSGSSCTRLEESRNILKKDQTPLSHDHTRLQFELVDHL